MNKKFRYIGIFLVLLIVIGLAISGCQQPAKPNQPNDNNNLTDPNTGIDNDQGLNGDNDNNFGNIDDNDLGMNGNTNNDTDMRDLGRRGEIIANKVEDINGVERATVFITENTAVVGVDLDGDAEGRITSDLKDRIQRTVRNVDTDIDTVSVTADVDLFDRIDNIARDIGTGRPISGFADEVQEILRRITPNM